MLFLLQDMPPHSSAGLGDAGPLSISLAEASALRLERALLARNAAGRIEELSAALSVDRALATWAASRAQSAGGLAESAGTDEITHWLAGQLETELAAALTGGAGPPPVESVPGADPEVEWRLPALAKLLAEQRHKLDLFDERLEHEKLEALKELAYGASHEINNPLANIAARAQTLLAEENDPENRRKLTAIHRQAMRAHEMIADLMLYARPPKLQRGPCDVGQIAAGVVEELSELAAEREVQLAVERSGGELSRLSADAAQLAVAIQAVVRNAIEAVGPGGHVSIAVSPWTHDDEGGFAGEWGGIEVTVRDDGPGISDEVRRHMFDPFFSGREAGRGLGFGLSKCWRIVTDHGGQVVVSCPAAGRGTEVTILLPLEGERIGGT